MSVACRVQDVSERCEESFLPGPGTTCCAWQQQHPSTLHTLCRVQVRFLEVVDKMVGQLLQLLWKQEVLQPQQCYSLIVTGDHSTPVQFGDHSHEPVPVAIAHVRHAVQVRPFMG